MKPAAAETTAGAASTATAAVEVTAAGGQSLGMIAGGAQATTFRIEADGSVTQQGGDFIRLRDTPLMPTSIEVSCQTLGGEGDGAGACDTYSGVWVTVSGGPASNWPGETRNFAIAGAVEGATLEDANVGGGNSSFYLACPSAKCPPNTVIRFRLSFDVVLLPSPISKAQTAAFNYTVEARWE
ncbi:MAG TPA: hypothetical protein VIO94_11800 [Phenylobacterium sp.]